MKLTTAEAIAELQKVDTLDMPARLCEAHYMAIKALEQESNICQSCKHYDDNEVCLECEYDGITRGMTRYESVLQEPKWDRLYNWLNDMRYGIAPDETVDDIDERNVRIAQTDLLDEIMEWIEKHQQEPKTGHWIPRPHIYGVAFCSECGFELKINNTNYCPNCGARMESEG